MSTRCNIHFCYGSGEIAANVYQHSDGYPDTIHGVLASLQDFFADVEEKCSVGYGGTRFNDPEYLAAKLIVWKAGVISRNDPSPLDFLGVSPCIHDHGDIQHVYEVDCSNHENGRPVVQELQS